jgi:hypothetical protein
MMDYNSSRKKLALPEYGRNIYQMVEHIKTINDREQRNKLARALVQIMGSMNPQLREMSDYKRKLWDHLFIMADYNLDVDSPYPKPVAEFFKSKPNRIPLTQSSIKFRRYGKNIGRFVEKALETEDAEIREALISIIANHMKKAYLLWNKEIVSDEVIFHDMKELSGGKLQSTDNVVLSETKDILLRNKKQKRTGRRDQSNYNNHREQGPGHSNRKKQNGGRTNH